MAFLICGIVFFRPRTSRPTNPGHSDCILTSVMSKGVCQILITGQPSVGKTTLVRNICSQLSKDFPALPVVGFYTQEIRDVRSNQRTGFEIVKLPECTGRKGMLSTVSPPSTLGKAPTVGKYTVLVEEFERGCLTNGQSELHPVP